MTKCRRTRPCSACSGSQEQGDLSLQGLRGALLSSSEGKNHSQRLWPRQEVRSPQPEVPPAGLWQMFLEPQFGRLVYAKRNKPTPPLLETRIEVGMCLLVDQVLRNDAQGPGMLSTFLKSYKNQKTNKPPYQKNTLQRPYRAHKGCNVYSLALHTFAVLESER